MRASSLVPLLLCLRHVDAFAASLSRASSPRVRRASLISSQLVRIEKPSGDGDDDDGGDGDETILKVSQVKNADGQVKAPTGRSVASLQFMITRAMRKQLYALGYTESEVDRMDPPRAASIIAKQMPSSKQAQSKPKSKRARFELQFTCNICDGPNSHSISWHAYNKGTVLVTCPGCQSSHLIADHLNWIEDDFKNLEQYMADRGTPIDRLVDDGVAAAAAAASASSIMDTDEEDDGGEDDDAAEAVNDPRRPWRGTKPGINPIEGIDDEQAARIREAVRERKRRKRAEGGGEE